MDMLSAQLLWTLNTERISQEASFYNGTACPLDGWIRPQVMQASAWSSGNTNFGWKSQGKDNRRRSWLSNSSKKQWYSEGQGIHKFKVTGTLRVPRRTVVRLEWKQQGWRSKGFMGATRWCLLCSKQSTEAEMLGREDKVESLVRVLVLAWHQVTFPEFPRDPIHYNFNNTGCLCLYLCTQNNKLYF